MISYSEPLGRAWTRMKSILFNPFDFGKWLALGFTAWLATLAEGGTSGGGGGSRYGLDRDEYDWDNVVNGTADRFRDFIESGLELVLVLFLVTAGLLVLLLLLWVSSRGSFMFLDNVIRNRSRVADPWRGYARLGDSLFLWRIGYSVACLVLFGSLATFSILMALPLFGDGVVQGVGIAGLVMAGTVGLALVLAVAFVSLLVDHFVVPLMYKHELTIMAAWRMFMPLLKRELPSFILYALFFLMLYIGVMVAVFVVSVATCCVGLLVIAIPYVGTVLLLPLYVTGRGLGPEFLAQFGQEYSLREQYPELTEPGLPEEQG